MDKGESNVYSKSKKLKKERKVEALSARYVFIH